MTSLFSEMHVLCKYGTSENDGLKPFKTGFAPSAFNTSPAISSRSSVDVSPATIASRIAFSASATAIPARRIACNSPADFK